MAEQGVQQMATVKITERDGRVIEVSDVSFEEIKQLVTPNTNGHALTFPAYAPTPETNGRPDYARFKAALSDHAKKFLSVLHTHPSGINADRLCEALGFASGNQIGGVTGGGIGKLVARFHINIADLYTVEKKREDGSRVVVYKPGREIEKVL